MERKTLLVVEDNDRIRNALLNILRIIFKEYQIDEATNGIGAMRAIEEAENIYSLIITDIKMPFMDGYELVLKLRAIDEYQEVSIIGYSSRLDINYKEKGFNYYIYKIAENIRQLINIIENVLNVDE